MADKISVLALFQVRPQSWLSPAEIKFGMPEVPDRTLRNWLTRLVADGAIESRGERKGRRYRLRSGSIAGTAASGAPLEGRRTVTPDIFSPESLALINRIEAPIYTRPPATYQEEWLESYVPNQSAYLTPKQREQLTALGKRDPIYGRARTYIKKIYDRLLIDFSFNSSRLEGNTYSLADTERLVLQGAAAPGKPDAERIMILNHKEAIAYLVRNVETLQPDEDTIRTIHYLLADSLVAPGLAGQIRDESIRVSGTTYAPLEGRERLTRLLFGLLEKARAIGDPFEQSFFLLVHWSYQRSCQRYDATAHAVGFDEIAALYRTQRRALVTDLVRAKVQQGKVAEWITANIPPNVEPQHREKFISDVASELKHLDLSRIGGLGITRQEFEAWQESRNLK
jgi:hypothetical protein